MPFEVDAGQAESNEDLGFESITLDCSEVFAITCSSSIINHTCLSPLVQ